MEEDARTVVYISEDRYPAVTSFISQKSGIKFLIYKNLSNFFTDAGTQLTTVDAVFVDVENTQTINGVNHFDILHSLNTIKNCVNPKMKLGIGVRKTASKTLVKELLNLDNIVGLYPHGLDIEIDEKVTALHEMLKGNFHVPDSIKQSIAKKKRNKEESSKKVKLTPRQSQILNLVVNRGSSNKSIARILKISESTVKLHMTAILKKFGCQNRTQLALFCKDKYTLD